VGAVDKGLCEIEFAARFQILGELVEHSLEYALANPLLKTPMAGLVRRVARRHVGPRCPGAQDPEDAIEHIAGIAPRATPVWPRDGGFLVGDGAANRVPLRIGQVHPDRRSQTRSAVDRLRESDRTAET
jgi:hypothetical protein